MLFVETLDEAAAASAAGIDILSIVEPLWSPAMREAAGDCFVQVASSTANAAPTRTICALPMPA